jgi:hypothetical protein
MTLTQIRGWLFLVFHSPLFGFWLLQVIFAAVGIYRAFSHPGELLAAIGAVGAVNRITHSLARAKGINPWPPSPLALSPTPVDTARLNGGWVSELPARPGAYPSSDPLVATSTTKDTKDAKERRSR